MQITLGECLKIAKEHEREIQRLKDLRRDEAFVYHDKDEEPDVPEHGVMELTEQIGQLGQKVRLLRRKAAEKNLATRIDFPETGDKITLAEGITLLGQLIGEREAIQGFLGQPERKRERATPLSQTVQYRTTTYNPGTMNRYAKKLDQDIRRLRTAIDRANVNTMVDLEPGEEELVEH